MFKNFFISPKGDQLNTNKLYLNEIDQLEEIISQSDQNPVLIFKHSTRCGISRMVLKNFEAGFSSEEHVSFYLLDILKYRNISNHIAEIFDVQHQSPQLIVLKNRKVLTHDSHQGILSMQW